MPGEQAPASPALRAPLAAALSVELQQLELLVVHCWQIFGVVGLGGGLAMALTLSYPLGITCAAGAAAFLGWFLLVERWLKRGVGGATLRVASTVVEGIIPWVFALLLFFSEGAEYTLASWVPPMLFCALIASYTGRLRPLASLGAGVMGALLYTLLYWALVRDRLSPDAPGSLAFQPPMQISRAVTLLVAGGLGMLVAGSQRRALGRAEIAVREQDLFGKYRMVRHVASGAMGGVFEAVYCPEGGFERRVAVKRIHPHLAGQQQFVTAFRREAELCARLAHPNVVQVMDFGRIGDSYFLAMEYVEGATLNELGARARAARRVLGTTVVGHIGREILGGLVHAHETARAADGTPLRVVHRDLCPQNVLVSTQGEVKLSDFGVARALRDAAIAHTQTVAGHISYMAPEQARGDRVDPRSDLFPLGALLWELLAGRRLFRRENEAATLMALLTERIPRVSADRPDIDPAWDEFLARALARDPDARFQSAREMLAALVAIPEGAAGDGGELAAIVAELLALSPVVEETSDEVSTQVITVS